MFLFHSSARINDHSPNVIRKMIGSHGIRMGFEVFRKRDDICRVLYQRQRKEICPIPRAYNVLENIRLVSLFVKIVLNFGYCLLFFFLFR